MDSPRAHRMSAEVHIYDQALSRWHYWTDHVMEAFAISNGVKQGCLLAPVLFNDFFTCMLSHAVRDLGKGVYICYRLDGSLFDLCRLAAKTKSLQSLLQEVLFADDCALMAHTESDLQLMLDRFSSASKLFGLTVSLGKTEVLHQPAPNTQPPAPNIVIDDTPLANGEHFKYLGSTISCDGSLDKEIVTRISKASQVLGRLRNRVLNQHNIRLLINETESLQCCGSPLPRLRL